MRLPLPQSTGSPVGARYTPGVAHWFIIGAGYTGGRLVARLRGEGEQVTATRRHATDGAVELDLARPETVRLPDDAIVVCLAPPGPDPAGEVALLTGARRLVYVSSTGVYGPGNGAWVDESWPLEPITKSGRARVLAERALPTTAVALRVAGIHGPGRGLVDRLRAGTYRIIGDGSAHVSRVHVDDLVEAIIAAGRSPMSGPVNIADDDPAPIGEVADELAARLGVAKPPRVDPATVDGEVTGMLLANRRIANRRMKQELGVVLRYPSWRDAPI
jgi:nucleoside-diphosphate-sugar epimerase